MGFVQYDHLVKTFPAYGADDSFAVWVLPGRTRCGEDLVNTHAFDTFDKVVAVDAVTVADEKTRDILIREGIDDLLGRPFGVGIGSHIEVDDSSPIVRQHEKDVQNTESVRRNREEVTSMPKYRASPLIVEVS